MGHEGHDPDHDHGEHHHYPHRHSPSEREHKAHAPAHVSAYVVTCSDSRTAKTDQSGRLIRELLETRGHFLAGEQVVPDEPERIRSALEEALRTGARAILFTGGTGIGRRDCTVETLQPFFEKTLPGFGELFRMLSYKELGSAAMMSRAVAGTCRGAVVFVMPGSPNAVKLAMEGLILPELGHAVRELVR